MADTTHITLLLALKDPANRTHWDLFARNYGPRIRGWCLRWCRQWGLKSTDASDVADEVTQHLLASIHQKMASYRVEEHRPGGYRAWLHTVAHNALIRYLQQRQRERGSGDSAVLERLAEQEARTDLEQELDRELTRELFPEVLARVRAEVSARDWQILEALGWEDGRSGKPAGAAEAARASVKEVAERHGMTVAAVAKVKSRIVLQLKLELARRLAALDHA
jgi:RNA polymerase sigma factor (sigma-70 family)